MEFHGRDRVLTGSQLADLVAISPDEEAMKLVRSKRLITSLPANRPGVGHHHWLHGQ